MKGRERGGHAGKGLDQIRTQTPEENPQAVVYTLKREPLVTPLPPSELGNILLDIVYVCVCV